MNRPCVVGATVTIREGAGYKVGDTGVIRQIERDEFGRVYRIEFDNPTGLRYFWYYRADFRVTG